MRKVITLFTVLFISASISENNLHSQWGAEMRMTENQDPSLTSFDNGYSVAASGDTVYIVWEDGGGSSFDIYFKRSVDGGMSWGAITPVSANEGESRFPSVFVSGSNVYVVWRQIFGTEYETYFKSSSNGGMTWGPDVRLTNDPANTDYPSIAVSGTSVHVVWSEETNQKYEVYYKRSTNGGISWDSTVFLTPGDTLISMGACITASGQYLHVIWYDYRDGNSEIYYKRSTDGGTTWENDVRLTDNFAQSRYPSITSSGDYVYAMWSDDRPGIWRVFFKRSTDAGTTWSADTALTGSPHFSEFPSCYASGQIIHAVWFDMRDGDWEIYYKRSQDWGVTWEPDVRISNAPDKSWFPSVTASGTIVHVVWSDYRDVNWEVYYKRNPTGNIVGQKIINNEVPVKFSLQQNYPNPFNPSTKIKFDIPSDGSQRLLSVKLIIYDALGREIATLVNGQLQAGTYTANWNASDHPSGVYFYKLISENYTDTKKMILVK